MLDDMMTVIRSEAIKQYPKEACGVVVRVGKKSLTLPCRNMSETARFDFIMHVGDYLDAASKGEVVGIWHTHVNEPAIASPADIVGCNMSDMPWFIVAIYKDGETFRFEGPTQIVPNGFQMPYLERPYVSGVFDCYSILRDYYKREHGIEIADYPRIEPDGTMGFTFFPARFEQEGFVSVRGQEPKRSDVFMLQINGHETNHIAVYVGDGQIMHHARGRLSRREIYGGMWAKHTTHHLRHKRLM